MPDSTQLSRNVLRCDAAFLSLAGGVAMVIETVGHFFGAGPFGHLRGSPYTIGGFEAHGLAVILAVLLFRASNDSARRFWHGTGLVIHAFLGTANLLFWPAFAAMKAVPMGVITTVLHGLFVLLHLACLRPSKR